VYVAGVYVIGYNKVSCRVMTPKQLMYLQSGELNFAVKTTEPRDLTVYANNVMKRVSIMIIILQCCADSTVLCDCDKRRRECCVGFQWNLAGYAWRGET
jgi:hypothetical protein